MELLSSIITQLLAYIEALDWQYILTFILLTYLLGHTSITSTVKKYLNLRLRKRYSVLLIGLGYGMLLWQIKAPTSSYAQQLFESFVFALVFHKLLIDLLVTRLLTKKPSNDATAS